MSIEHIKYPGSWQLNRYLKAGGKAKGGSKKEDDENEDKN